jgi:nucleotide-binding universal stress UspA family protein
MHAYEAPFEGKMAYSGVDEDAIAHYVRARRTEAGQQIRELAQESGLKPGKFSLMLRHGHPYREVIEAHRHGEFDCIAIGKHGRGFVTQLVLGSTTEHVLLESSADVLVIPLPS